MATEGLKHGQKPKIVRGGDGKIDWTQSIRHQRVIANKVSAGQRVRVQILVDGLVVAQSDEIAVTPVAGKIAGVSAMVDVWDDAEVEGKAVALEGL